MNELQRLLSNETMEAKSCARPCPGPQAQKTAVALNFVAEGWPVTAVEDAVGMSREHSSAMHNRPPLRRRGRPSLPDAELVADTKMPVADLPNYGYRRVHALLRHQGQQTGRAAPNSTRVYRGTKRGGSVCLNRLAA